MATTLKLRRGTTAAHSTFTGAAGEVTVDTDKEVVVVHDGSTAGGFPLLGATTPQALSVNSTSDALRITQTGTGNALLVEDSTNPDSSPFVVDQFGFIIAGYTSNIDGSQIQTFNGSQTNFRWNAASTGPSSFFKKSRSATIGSYSAVGSGDTLGTLRWSGDDGVTFIEAASISGRVDGTPGTNDMPGRLVFSTSAPTTGTLTERMRIDSSGNVGIGRTAEAGYQLDIANPDTTAAAKTLVRVSSSAASGDGDAEVIIDAKGSGEASLRVREDGVERGYFASFGDTDVLQITNVTVDSDLMFMGADTTYNDTYSLRYQRASGVAPVTGITGTITSSANKSTITGLSTTTGLVIGMVLTKTAGTGVLGTQACIQSIDSASQITVTNGFAALTAGSITFTATPNPTTITAMSASGGTWAAGQDFARFAFGNLDASGVGDGGIRASINAYTYDTAGTGAGMDFYVSTDGTTLIRAMRIDEFGKVGIGTTTPGALLNVAASNTGLTGITANNTIRFTDTDTTTAANQPIGVIEFYSEDISAGGTGVSAYILSAAAGTSGGGDLRFGTAGNTSSGSPAERLRIVAGDGTLTSQPTYDNTAAGSTVVVTSAGLIRRTSSSLKYKKDVETLDYSLASNAIENLRPVWYRTKTAAGDDKETWSHIGLIAEEVHEIEPRLVRYRTVEVNTDEFGERVETPLEVPEPEDVDYGRLAVLLLAEVKTMKNEISNLKAEIAALKGV